MVRKTKKKDHPAKRYFWLMLYTVLVIVVSIALYEHYRASIHRAVQPTETPSPQKKNRPLASARVTHYPDLEITQDSPRRRGQLIRHTAYTLSYNASRKIPNWVAYELLGSHTRGKVSRTNRFIPDPLVKGKSATTADYTGSGYDRGHMAAAADMAWNKKAMAESFYLSNICPQKPVLNRGLWKNLEDQVRRWAVSDSAIVIVTGPIVGNSTETIGKNRIAVPQSFFKVILSPYGKKVKAIGFLLDNKEETGPLKNYAVSVDSIERLTGLDFFSSLPDELEKRAEATVNLKDWKGL